jgi:hypothetical protein
VVPSRPTQIFGRSSNNIARASIAGLILLLAAVAIAGYMYVRSDYYTQQHVTVIQPVQFSHEHHVGGLGIGCRYCHTSVETSSFAGIPPTQTCMNCHSVIWNQAPILQPVRDSWNNNQPLQWTRVYNLPQYVYFNHSPHIQKGIGCETCHGRLDQMQQTYKATSLQMEWCLQCHRNPEQYIRPKDQVFTMGYVPAQPQSVLGPQLVKAYNVLDARTLTSCSTCHR